MNKKNADVFTSLYDQLYNELYNEKFTDKIFRDKYLVILENTLTKNGIIKNDLRCGSYKEVEVYRKYDVWY
jgi:hypothetical protein